MVLRDIDDIVHAMGKNIHTYGLPELDDHKDEEGYCDRTTSKMRGFVSQDHIGGFSTKRECANTHK
jgi:hypothetical protein